MSGRVVWERWQSDREDSPHEVVISDEGWSILRTAGFRPEVIAVSPDGRDAARVHISSPRPSGVLPPLPQGIPCFRWMPRSYHDTTAGAFWSFASWRYFLIHNQRPFFVWRTSSGERLILDLEAAALVGKDTQADLDLLHAMEAKEREGAYLQLLDVSVEMERLKDLLRLDDGETLEGDLLRQKLKYLFSAMNLAGVHRIERCIPLLRTWEEPDWPGCSTGSAALGRGWWLEGQRYRAIVHHSLRLLGEVPRGFAAYHFRQSDKPRFEVPECIADRHLRKDQLHQSMSAEGVLRLIGSPDHIHRESHKAGKLYRWTEDWEYDFLGGEGWTTLRLVWSEDGKSGRITAVDEGPATWMHDERRLQEILRF
jgi:hypothetical protein